MAKARFSILLNSLQGKLGAATFTDTPYGPVVRETVVDAQQPNSPSQQAVKNRFSLVASSWNALTDAQKIAWATWAQTQRRVEPDTKVSYRLTGYNAYSALANLWYQANNNTGTPPVAPPASAFAGSAITISAAATSNTITFTGSAVFPANVVGQFEIQQVKNTARKPSKTGWRVKAVSAFTATGTTLAVTVTPGVYVARYAFVNKLTGQRSGFREIAVSGVALGLEDGGADEVSRSRSKKAA